jgi:hypothetical protein
MTTTNPTKGVPPLLVHVQDPDRSLNQCHWFLSCEKSAYADVEHATLGTTPICEGHLHWLLEDAHE